MAPPQVLSTIFSGVSAVGAGISAFAGYKKGKAEKGAYEYNADVTLQKMEYGERSLQNKI